MTLDPALLLAAERAVDAGSALLRRSRWQVGAIVSKGDRDYATEVDFRIEETIRTALQEVAPGIGFLGEEEGERGRYAARRCGCSIRSTGRSTSRTAARCARSRSLSLRKGQPMLGIIDLPLLGERYVALRGGGASLNGSRINVIEPSGLHDAMVGFADFAVGPTAKVENPVHAS